MLSCEDLAIEQGGCQNCLLLKECMQARDAIFGIDWKYEYTPPHRTCLFRRRGGENI